MRFSRKKEAVFLDGREIIKGKYIRAKIAHSFIFNNAVSLSILAAL